MKVTETRKQIAKADEVRLLCPHCSNSVFVKLEWPYTSPRKQAAIKKGIEEHRVLCPKAPPEAKRVYEISYPRA